MSLHSLPNELLLLIAQELRPKDLKHLLETSRRLSVLLTSRLHNLARLPKSNLPALHWAVLRNHLPLVKLLLADGDIQMANSICRGGWTALHYAAAEGRTEMVKLLLEKGASTTLRDPIGETALKVTAEFSSERRFALLAQFPAYRVSSDTRPVARWHRWAGDNEHEIITRLLLSHGADKDSACHFGRTPLHWAVKVRNLAIVRVLLDAGSDVDVATADGDTPLIWAIANPTPAEQDVQMEIITLLLAHGANVAAQNNVGYTALQQAAIDGFAHAAALLLECDGVGLNIHDSRGRTALHHAAMEILLDGDYDGLIRMLLKAGADFEALDEARDTALHLAARMGAVTSVKLLVQKGTWWERENSEGNTAYEDIMKGWWPDVEAEKEERREVLIELFLETKKARGGVWEKWESRCQDPSVCEVRECRGGSRSGYG